MEACPCGSVNIERQTDASGWYDLCLDCGQRVRVPRGDWDAPDDGETYHQAAGRIYPHYVPGEGTTYRTWAELNRHERWLARFDREGEE